MANIDGTGVTPETLEGYTERLNALLRSIFGEDLPDDPETIQGQLALTFGEVLTECDELGVHLSNGLGVYTAAGLQQDRLFGAMQIKRIAGTRSTVTATLTGTASTQIPAGTRASVGSGGSIFRTTADAIIGAGGTVSVDMESAELGPVAAAAGALDTLVDVIAGWTAITNAAAAALGRNAETAREYRRRYVAALAVNAGDSVEAIQARLRVVDNVTDVRVLENTTDSDSTIQGLTVGAHSIMAIVEGGTDAAVALALYLAKGSAGTSGAESESVTRRGLSETVNFQRVTTQELAVAVTIDALAAFPGDGVNQIRQRVADYIAGDWTSGAGDFDTGGLGIGERLDVNRLYSPINSVPGHRITALAVTLQGGGAFPATINGDVRQTLAYADVTVTVN